jgi:mRNA interferase MazF|tara:strand:+ start:547 stop:876 length:330 start_codon:yes stop_codon:yes gene_type:complete
MRFEQREIVQIPFPYSDLSGSKKRPAIIISNEKVNGSSNVICCVVTTNPHKIDIPISNRDLEKIPLPFDSYIKHQMLFTVNKTLIIKKMSKLKQKPFNKLKERIYENIN